MKRAEHYQKFTPKTTIHGQSLTKQMAFLMCPRAQKSQLCQTRRGSKFLTIPDFSTLLGSILSQSESPCQDAIDGGGISSMGIGDLECHCEVTGSQGKPQGTGVPGAYAYCL